MKDWEREKLVKAVSMRENIIFDLKKKLVEKDSIISTQKELISLLKSELSEKDYIISAISINFNYKS